MRTMVYTLKQPKDCGTLPPPALPPTPPLLTLRRCHSRRVRHICLLMCFAPLSVSGTATPQQALRAVSYKWHLSARLRRPRFLLTAEAALSRNCAQRFLPRQTRKPGYIFESSKTIASGGELAFARKYQVTKPIQISRIGKTKEFAPCGETLWRRSTCQTRSYKESPAGIKL